jgi:hypothetical protein
MVSFSVVEPQLWQIRSSLTGYEWVRPRGSGVGSDLLKNRVRLRVQPIDIVWVEYRYKASTCNVIYCRQPCMVKI